MSKAPHPEQPPHLLQVLRDLPLHCCPSHLSGEMPPSPGSPPTTNSYLSRRCLLPPSSPAWGTQLVLSMNNTCPQNMRRQQGNMQLPTGAQLASQTHTLCNSFLFQSE